MNEPPTDMVGGSFYTDGVDAALFVFADAVACNVVVLPCAEPTPYTLPDVNRIATLITQLGGS